ncbi:hypothetical protein [Mesobacillus foraminis]|uniref:Uncharacterized protein n=1 Tax=Mesobacillus foraminis TaxID=279826 RepID=A0A4R2BL92_9BACI|nr:hypothetical protein [Mesobacillus foraminis]TCN27312.1 hypothetical protein EV146_102261 [Mesobacillus foraminis]
MEFERQKVNLLAKSIQGFVKFVNRSYKGQFHHISNPEKLYRLKLIVEEYNFSGIGSELARVNKHVWDGRATGMLLDRFKSALGTVAEYIENNENDLFIFTARVYTIKSLMSSLRE